MASGKLSLEQEPDGHSSWGHGSNRGPKESERVYLGQEKEILCLKFTLGIGWSFQVYGHARSLAPWGHRSCYSSVFISGQVVSKLKMQSPGEILQVDWEQGQGWSLSVRTWVLGGFGGLKDGENMSEKDSISRRDLWWEILLRASWISGVGSQLELSVIQFGNAWYQECFRPPILEYLCTHSGLLGMGLTSVRAICCTCFFLCFILTKPFVLSDSTS